MSSRKRPIWKKCPSIWMTGFSFRCFEIFIFLNVFMHLFTQQCNIFPQWIIEMAPFYTQNAINVIFLFNIFLKHLLLTELWWKLRKSLSSFSPTWHKIEVCYQELSLWGYESFSTRTMDVITHGAKLFPHFSISFFLLTYMFHKTPTPMSFPIRSPFRSAVERR